MTYYAGTWLPWFAWYPVRLQEGGFAWMRTVEWNTWPVLRGGIGFFTEMVPVYRPLRNEQEPAGN